MRNRRAGKSFRYHVTETRIGSGQSGTIFQSNREGWLPLAERYCVVFWDFIGFCACEVITRHQFTCRTGEIYLCRPEFKQIHLNNNKRIRVKWRTMCFPVFKFYTHIVFKRIPVISFQNKHIIAQFVLHNLAFPLYYRILSLSSSSSSTVSILNTKRHNTDKEVILCIDELLSICSMPTIAMKLLYE